MFFVKLIPINFMRMKKLILSAIALVFMGIAGFAQDLPSFVSRGGDVRWFYLQNVATERYLISTGSDVYSEPKADFSNFEKLARQLWCFTTEDGEYYTITNRYDGLQMDNGLSAKHYKWESVQMKPKAEARFKIHLLGGDTISLEADRPAPGGGEIYRFPAVYDNAANNYMLWMVREQYGQGADARFVVKPFAEAKDPEMQNAVNVPYYNIVSGKAGADNEVVFDNTSVVDTKFKFVVAKKETGNDAAQWRLVSLRPGKVAIINRATGNSISSDIYADGQYNLPEADAQNVVAKTWNINAVSADEFVISSIGEDNIVRYLNNTTFGEAPETPDVANMGGSGFAWKFVKADEAVGINEAKNSVPTVSVENGKVVVSGGLPFTIFAPDGVQLPSSSTLQRGIYIINVAGKSVKINVR